MAMTGRFRRGVPLWVKIAYTAFVAVLVPKYLIDYGPTNFLYFCDVALLLTLGSLWTGNALLASAAAVGILLPQLIWMIDLVGSMVGLPLTGMTAYMFDAALPLFTRLLSLFHLWLPLFLLWVLARLGYDRRGFPFWVALGVVLMTLSYLFVPPPPAPADKPWLPVNVNYVYGLSDAEAQHWMSPQLYFLCLQIFLPVFVFFPTHLLLRRIYAAPR